MLTRIHVNQHVIRRNRNDPRPEPPLTVKTYRDNRYAHAVEVHGPSRVVYSPDRPLACGARVWIETEADVTLHGEPGSGQPASPRATPAS
jgi:hypothetical protein